MGNACCSSMSSPSPPVDENTSSSPPPPSLNENGMIEDATHLDELIAYIDQLLKDIIVNGNASGTQVLGSARVTYCVQFGSDLMHKILTSVHGIADYKIDFKAKLAVETRKVIGDVLKGAAKIHFIGMGLSVVGHVLKQFDKVSTNRKQCVQLLQYMFALAKRINQLDEQVPQEKEKLNNVLEFIVKGSILCISQMKASKLSRFFTASVDAEDLKAFESQLGHTYPDLILASVIALLEARPTLLPPSQGEYPDAVGIDNAREEVIDLLELMNDKSRKAVVVYGVGGIGKTTLATAVFNRIHLTGYKLCRLHIDQNCDTQALKLLQQQILQDLFKKNIVLRDCVEGQEQLSNAFMSETSQPVFMFIDNALRGSDLAKILPRDLSCLPVGSKMLITTRKLDETNMLLQSSLQRAAYSMGSLSIPHAKQLLCKKALGNADACFGSHVNIDSLVESCGGIPLVLEMVGSNLSQDGSNVSHWVKFLNETLLEGQGDLSESVVDCVYNSLQGTSYKEAFLDIASYFQNWKWAEVGYIVGEVQLKGLQEAALVNISDQGRLKMHDIVGARGRWLSKSNRIISVQSLKDALQHKQTLGQMKGIWLSDNDEEIEFEAEDMEVMSKSLRVLYLGKCSKLQGRCKTSFENLLFLYIFNSGDDFSPVDLNKLNRLAFFCGAFSVGGNVSKLPQSLRLLKVKSCLDLPESFGNISSLQKLKLLSGSTFTNLPASFGQLECLTYLTINHCEHLTRLPESFGNLSALAELKIYWSGLQMLPRNFGELKSLRHLKLRGCSKLTALPESFGNLSNLEELDLGLCSSLVSLPQSFARLKHLKYLSMEKCKNLKKLCDNFGRLTSLAAVDAGQCFALEGKAMDSLVEVNNLMFLNIRKSPMLRGQWEHIKEKHSLVVYSRKQGYELVEMMSTALFHEQRRMVHVDGGGKLVEGSSFPSFLATGAKVALLFTMCNLSSPSNGAALEIVKKKILQLGRERESFQIVYVYVGLLEQSDEIVRQTLVCLLPGSGSAVAVAWIAPDRKTRQLFGYCAYASVEERPMVLNECHSFIASTSVWVDEDSGKKCVKAPFELRLPQQGEDNNTLKALGHDDFAGGFQALFSPLALLLRPMQTSSL